MIWAETERYDIFWPRNQAIRSQTVRANLQVNLEPSQHKTDVVPHDSSSGNLHKTSVREKSRGVYLSLNRLSFSEFIDDISLLLTVRRLCVIVAGLSSAAKSCDCVIW